MERSPHQNRVVLADDHADLLDEIRSLLTPDFEILEAVTDGAALVAAARGRKPDVVISDIQMPGLDGIEACRRIIRERHCGAAILLTMYNDRQLVRAALDGGIRGYVLKVDAGEELISAIDAVLGGSLYFSRGVRKGAQ